LRSEPLSKFPQDDLDALNKLLDRVASAVSETPYSQHFDASSILPAYKSLRGLSKSQWDQLEEEKQWIGGDGIPIGETSTAHFILQAVAWMEQAIRNNKPETVVSLWHSSLHSHDSAGKADPACLGSSL